MGFNKFPTEVKNEKNEAENLKRLGYPKLFRDLQTIASNYSVTECHFGDPDKIYFKSGVSFKPGEPNIRIEKGYGNNRFIITFNRQTGTFVYNQSDANKVSFLKDGKVIEPFSVLDMAHLTMSEISKYTKNQQSKI